MNKKQKNRKLVVQNKRNRVINRRYLSTIKTLAKLFKLKVKECKSDEILNNCQNKERLQKDCKNLLNSFYSIVDKAVKKNVIHKNTASRKKSKMSKIKI